MPKFGGPSEADLKRQPAAFYKNPALARKRGMNWAIALGLVGFAGGAYAWTIFAVSRNDFDDFDEQGNLKQDGYADEKE
jgi:Cytochrome c oxidase assembly factor 3